MGLIINDCVEIVAKDDFYAFVDGWRGVIVGWQSGCAEVLCLRPDGPKTLFVPEDQLIINLGKRA